MQALLSAYNDATGEHAKPFTQGGGTYARKFSCAASFGPEMPLIEMPEWAGGMHGPDETVPEELLKKAFKIYALTIARLMELDAGGLARRVALRSARRGARRITRPLSHPQPSPLCSTLSRNDAA